MCTTICSVLKDECFPQPTAEKLKEISEKFDKRLNFPNCIGGVGFKSIRVMKPQFTSINKRDYFIVKAVVDCDYQFVYVDIGDPYCSDSNTAASFYESTFLKEIIKHSEAIHLPHDENSLVPYVFVADEGFGLYPNVMRPYCSKSLTVDKRVFNYRLNRARRCVDSAFAILSSKFKIFHRPLNVSLELASKIIHTCCILHNFVKERDGSAFEDTLTVTGFQDFKSPVNYRGTTPALDVRQKFTDYFMSEKGSLPWQMNTI